MFCKNLFSQKKEEVWSSFSVKPAKFKRLAIYAAYNPDGYIDASDLNYLKALTEVADNIIYVADNALRTGEENKNKKIWFATLKRIDITNMISGLISAVIYMPSPITF